MTDHELQEHVEKNGNSATGDAAEYQAVFRALRTEPAFSLRADFADRVVARLQTSGSNRDMAWLAIGVFLISATLGITVLLTGFTLTFGAFTFLSGYPGLVAFGALFILALQWVDRRWIRKPVV